ncbi:10720_t:CDS:2 [Ambispora gerdemannii]|uniref:10720_t:CDS:1 n=1 Tax=Ambispora gerdemannii TaxID=144530 RepID=A0A9N8YMP3_9GLOM|nr:10720_t:CDS:2 [Ambispora gerdemannii]
MKCSACQINKLTNEFPPTKPTDKCEHVSTLCLRCLVAEIEKQKKPSSIESIRCVECNSPMNETEQEFLLTTWRNAAFKLDNELDLLSQNPTHNNYIEGDTLPNNGHIYVVLLNGHKLKLDLAKVPTVYALKMHIKMELGVQISKQKLLFNRQELNATNKLSNYGIRDNSHVQLIVILYSISEAEAVRSLVFDLNWGFPSGVQDYLDGTCMVYSGAELLMIFDYSSNNHPNFPNMRHSGDVIDYANSRGSHQITAKLDELPGNVTHLYFILSAWNCDTIGKFNTPMFKLCDESRPDIQLCHYTLQDAANSQAVIMCCVTRIENGMWQVIQVGRLSRGNAKNYKPIQDAIRNSRIII